MTRCHRLGSMLGLAVAALTATLVCRLGSAQTTVIGQFTGDANTWDDSTTNPCIGTTKTDEVCTKLTRGGPNNATYVVAYTILDREHIINVGVAATDDQLTVAVDGRTLFMDPTVQATALVQTWHFPSADSHALDVSWQRYDPHYGGPSVNFTCKTATYVVWLAYAQQGRPARLSKADDRPVYVTGPSDRVNPSATGFAGREFEISDLASGRIYCLLTSPYHQVAAKILKAGPRNATVYVTGFGIMYKEHEVLVEVNNDGSGIIVTVDGTQLKLPDNWFEDSWTYDCLGGGSVTVLWQLYRPLLGNTVEITTDLLQIMVWLVPARKENIPLNVPPYLNAQTSVLQAINDTGYFQGMLGETYDRMLEGKAVTQTENPLYLPDDNKFHGMGKRAQYLMDSYWDTNHTFNLYNATSVPDSVLAMRLAHNLPPPSSTIFQDAANLTHTIIPPPPRSIDPKRLAIVISVLLSALVLSSCLCFVIGYHRGNLKKALQLPRQLSASLKLPLAYEKHTDEHKP